jgi:hypothetical protein
MNRIFWAAFQLYLVTLKYNNSTGMAVYEHFILQEAGYVPCIPLTRISTETSLFNWSKESVHKRMYYHGPYTKGNLLLLAIGGIEFNPGPRSIKYPCGSCNKACHAVGIKNQLHAINATNGFTQLVWEYQHLCMKLFQTHQYHGHVTNVIPQTIPQYCMNQSCLFQTRSRVYRLAYITSQVTHPSVNSGNRQQHRHPKE